jgi:hypothetical protein
MAVDVEKESEDLGGPPYEECCVCSFPTPYWFTKNDVPLCEKCAVIKEEKDIPTKEQWINS